MYISLSFNIKTPVFSRKKSSLEIGLTDLQESLYYVMFVKRVAYECTLMARVRSESRCRTGERYRPV